MDEDWAFERQWPESMRLPSDGSKRVCLLEAYHQLDCLVRFRFRIRDPNLSTDREAEDHPKNLLGSG